MTADQFVRATLQEIKRDFFDQVSEKRFWQEAALLKSAITYPAAWLLRRGGQWITIGLMRKILTTIIAIIKKHGDRANIGRFSVYFLHCVQGHMNHHGDEYLQEAKQMPTVGRFVKGAVADLRAQTVSADPGAVLAETNRILGRGRRQIRESKNISSTPDLFGPCNRAAKAAQKHKKFLKPLHFHPPAAKIPQT